MNLNDLAQRYSRFDGFHLVDFEPVAIPFWFVAYEAQVLAEKPIPLLDEFLLRAIEAKVDTVPALAAFLGVGEKITVRRLGGLHANGYIRLLTPQGSQDASYALTQTGSTAVKDAASIKPKEQKVVIAYDGLSQRVIPRKLEHAEVLDHHAIRNRGLLKIPALPTNDRAPSEDVLNGLDLNRDLPKELREEWDIHHVLSARKLGNLTRRAREAYMLLYRSDSDDSLVTARFFSLTGRPMPEIDQAFRKHEGARKLDLASELKQHRESLQRELETDPAYSLIVKFAAPGDSTQEAKIADQLSAAARIGAKVADREKELRQEEKAADPSREQIDALRAEITQLKKEKQALETNRLAGSRRLGPHEHAPLLKRTIAEANKRLVIVSPWISDDVMNKHQRGLEDFVKKRKGELFIGYGISARPEDDQKKSNDRETLAFFQRLKSSCPHQVHVVRLGDTHAKVLIKDTDFLVIGSFNWMSFGGENWGSGIREELSYFVKEPADVEETFSYYFKRFAKHDRRLAARLPSGPSA